MLSLGGSQRSRDNEPDSMGQLFAQLLLLFFRAMCLTIDVILHAGGFGNTYLRAGPAALLLGLWFLAQFPGDDPGPLTSFLAVFAVVWAVAAGRAVVRWWRGEPRYHSLATGRPLLCVLVPRWREGLVKVGEPAVVAGVGWLARAGNPPLGDWLLLAGSLAFARAVLQEAGQRGDAVEMSDMVIEELASAERFRDLRQPPR